MFIQKNLRTNLGTKRLKSAKYIKNTEPQPKFTVSHKKAMWNWTRRGQVRTGQVRLYQPDQSVTSGYNVEYQKNQFSDSSWKISMGKLKALTWYRFWPKFGPRWP